MFTMEIEFVYFTIAFVPANGCLYLCFDLTPLLAVRKEYFRFFLGFSNYEYFSRFSAKS